jgi:glycine/D-amino acid oxidase-like deaminating enzyme
VTPTVVVIGGGIVGAATAWSLAREGVDVLLLESRRFGEQSTGKSAAIVRCHYSNPEVVRMALHSRETLRRLPHLLDCDPVYERTGWLFLVDEHDADVALRNAEMQVEEGVDNLDVDDLEDYLPGVDPTGIAYALYEPSSGFADPVATTNAYVAAFRRRGGEARELTSVEAIEVGRGRVRGVRVGGELLESEIVVLAAGPWSGALARSAGIELPLEITREQDVVFTTDPEPTIPCAVSSQVDRVYLRPAPEHGAGRLLAGRGFPKEYERAEPDSYDERVGDEFERDVHGRVAQRLPRLAGMRAVGGRVGLYDVTPDWHPIVGPVGEPENLVLATGGSGHCFKLAPAIGELVTAQILGRSVAYADAGSFSLERFATGREFASTYGGNRA